MIKFNTEKIDKKTHTKKMQKNSEELVLESLKEQVIELSQDVIDLQRDKIALTEQVCNYKVEVIELKKELEHYKNKKK